jgi:hypothetical protein
MILLRSRLIDEFTLDLRQSMEWMGASVGWNQRRLSRYSGVCPHQFQRERQAPYVHMEITPGINWLPSSFTNCAKELA